MAKGTCTVDGCERLEVARQLCEMHYRRHRRLGSTDLPTKGVPVISSLSLSPADTRIQVGPGTGCWLWMAAVNQQGYGIVGGRMAHRVLYASVVGAIPADLQLDHLCHTSDPACAGGPACRHRRCVNPAHLEPVTPRMNALRSNSFAGVNAAKTHCKRGHAFDQRNTYVKPTGWRGCRTCHADRERARRSAS